ncbi:TOMM system kinase/cyclase fusion protein [Hyalangium rubrum]|uniref:TOMM system kinase/cyclase fusion protein n=1 Tax=Hyalangium rubrum TaxID=3103134 RepID=A0ABU5H646_9BACT|nr:TOMM system kinase/cyclase fusion protein [Hyalangium sp. s54d21]MDY7228949.1 TOMM system kinase/cyclase fusion protein [Hyalangium sp. s54d21]
MDPITAGTVFQNRYEILGKLGEGGFGQVYRARQMATRHEVAIKVLRALHTTNDSHIARFQREMQLCAQLYHPNIVRFIDSGKAEPDLLYTVFEYVPGKTLADVLAEDGALTPWEAAHLMLQVLDALACAHNRSVIHRDLKPQNIMVTTTGVRRNALVLDFGLGTLAADSPQEDMARITRTSEMLGTPSYAAPEQLRGEPVTARSDLYSWGLIFLECLTGRRVVEGATLQQLIHKQLGPEPIAVPSWLENHRLGRLLRKVTNKNAETRDISAQSVLRELEACSSEGWPLSDAQLARTPTSAQMQMPETVIARNEGERRQLTAVCCSLRLVGAADGATDEEDMDRMLRALNASCASIARSYDAHVGGVLGEWVLFYFGYPKAQEDDARRAARAALAMVARMEQQGASLARDRGGRVEFRVGIHTGLVISQEPRALGPGDLPALIGSTPNTAVRLEARAEPGTILISEATSRLLRGHFATEPASDSAFRLLHEYRGLASSQLLEGSAIIPLYGRTQELEFLSQRWWQVVAGTGQSVLLTGEPGIGKSRLVQELIRQVRGTSHALLECRCTAEGRNSVLDPVVDLLSRLLGVSPDWTPEQTVSALEALLSQHGFVLDEAMPLFLGLLSVKAGADRYPPPNVSPQLAKERMLDAVVSLFFEMAQQQPLLLSVEDLHWADPTTLEMLAQLVSDVPTARICLMLTSRPDFSPPWTVTHHLQLSRLDRKRVEEMVSGLTQKRPLPKEVVEQLVNRTDGVPLFVEELTRVVAESLPVGTDTPTRLYSPSQLSIPTTLRDSLTSRLDRLGPAKELAQLAAALGREFNYEVLKAVSEREEQELQRELKALVDADLVHRRRGVRSPTYLFKHALIRDTAYESMLKPLRRQVHARIAATLEAHFPELVETRPDLLAMHHATAEQKRQALGYAQRAGMAALMRYANQETVAHITEALSWLEVVEDPRERATLELGLNIILIPAMMVIRGWSDERIKELVEHSQQLIDFLGDSPQIVPTLWALWLYHNTRGHRAQARTLVDRLLSMAEQTGNGDLKLMALAARGNNTVAEGSLRESRASFEQVLSLYEPARHLPLAIHFGFDARAWAETSIALVKWMLGYPDQANAHIQAGFSWAQECKHPSSLGTAYLYRLTIFQVRGEREQLVQAADTGLEFTQRHGLAMQTAYCQMLRSWAVRDADSLRKALAAQESIGLELGMTYYKSLLADVECDAQRYDSALEVIQDVMAWGRRLGEHYMMPELLRLESRCLSARGDTAGAEACLRESISIAREQSSKMAELKSTHSLYELLQLRGQESEIREILAALLQGFNEGLDSPDIARARALLGQRHA